MQQADCELLLSVLDFYHRIVKTQGKQMDAQFMQEEGKREDTFDLSAQTGTEEEGDLKTKKDKKLEKKMSFLLELMNDDHPSKKKEQEGNKEESKHLE